MDYGIAPSAWPQKAQGSKADYRSTVAASEALMVPARDRA